ncbi:MAG: DNA adenine methylase [Akkermansia sp.]
MTIKPFVKWAGGKGQLLNEITKVYPEGLGSTITKYAEPFVGGGAVLFDMLSNFQLEEVYISDINADLINVYRIIQQNVDELVTRLQEFQAYYLPLDSEKRKVYYYEKRAQFNMLDLGSKLFNVEKAALFIFLNRTCFNGLYRVNKRGLYNVPMGAYKNPCICDEANLRAVSKALQGVHMHCAPYEDVLSFVDESTFVYFDPPYRPLNQTSSFTSYSELEFGDKEQIELAEFAMKLNARGAKLLLSNSDPKNVDVDDDFFDNLYKDFNINRVQATRMINSKSASRGKISELLISNY